MRKIVLMWTVVVVLGESRVSPAQSKQSARDSTRSPASLARTIDSKPGYSGIDLEFESEPDDEDADRVLYDRRSTRGRTRLASAEDSNLIIPDPRPIVRDEEPVSEYKLPEPVHCKEFWEHRCGVWGEFLFLRPRGTDVTYASTVDGTLATSVPLGDRSVAAFNYDTGYRVGAAWAFDSCSSLTANYTAFQSTASDSVSLPGGGGSFLAAETVHPNTVNVAADSLAASALYDFKLQAVDLNYKGLFAGDDCYAVNYLAGVRYASVEQQFEGAYSILGSTTVDADLNFHGIGPRFGFEAERRMGSCGMMVYSKGAVNFLVGRSSADYLQTNVFTGVQAQTGQYDSRIVTVPELEIGGGWQSCNGCFRITAGYYLGAWFNMLTTPEYLSSVRTTQNTFEDQIKTLTLDGLTIRTEFRY